MTAASEREHSNDQNRALKLDAYIPFMFLFLLIFIGLSILYPTHSLLFARCGFLLTAAAIGFLLGLYWDQRLDSLDDSVTDLPSFLRPRAMLLGVSVLLPLIALGAGVAYYSGSHKMADLTTGLVEMSLLAAVEAVFVLIGRVVQQMYDRNA